MADHSHGESGVMMAKLDSTWSFDNGLPNFVTKLLHFSMVGYRYIIPDVVGGNGLDGSRPDKELYIRWMQAAALVPDIQFSYAPWDYDAETIKICKELMDLRKYEWTGSWTKPNKYILTMAPIWWLDPSDYVALGINDGMFSSGGPFGKIDFNQTLYL